MQGEDGFVDAGGTPFHRECWLRIIFGSVTHQSGMCSCHGVVEEVQEPGSKRDQARCAVAFYEQHANYVNKADTAWRH